MIEKRLETKLWKTDLGNNVQIIPSGFPSATTEDNVSNTLNTGCPNAF